MKKKYLIFDLDGTLINSPVRIVSEVLDFVNEVEPEYYDKTRYVMSKTFWLSLKEIFKMVFEDDDKIKKYCDEAYKRLDKLRGKLKFFPWIPEKIKELSKKYKLFLSTWSSTDFAEDSLQEWWIKDCFEMIFWSEKVMKGSKHLEAFVDYSWDDKFFERSVYIWDGDMDRVFAEKHNIDFVFIWNKGIDKYEIKSVVEIDEVLKRI